MASKKKAQDHPTQIFPIKCSTVTKHILIETKAAQPNTEHAFYNIKQPEIIEEWKQQKEFEKICGQIVQWNIINSRTSFQQDMGSWKTQMVN